MSQIVNTADRRLFDFHERSRETSINSRLPSCGVCVRARGNKAARGSRRLACVESSGVRLVFLLCVCEARAWRRRASCVVQQVLRVFSVRTLEASSRRRRRSFARARSRLSPFGAQPMAGRRQQAAASWLRLLSPFLATRSRLARVALTTAVDGAIFGETHQHQSGKPEIRKALCVVLTHTIRAQPRAMLQVAAKSL